MSLVHVTYTKQNDTNTLGAVNQNLWQALGTGLTTSLLVIFQNLWRDLTAYHMTFVVLAALGIPLIVAILRQPSKIGVIKVNNNSLAA